MIFAFIAALTLITVAFLVIQDRTNRRAAETQNALSAAHRIELGHLMERLARERESHRIEIQSLCQRIQAPEVAVMQHQIDTAGPPEQTYPLNDAEAARRQEQELLERIRQMEQAEAMSAY